MKRTIFADACDLGATPPRWQAYVYSSNSIRIHSTLYTKAKRAELTRGAEGLVLMQTKAKKWVPVEKRGPCPCVYAGVGSADRG